MVGSVRETKGAELKDRFDPSSEGEWCALLKNFAPSPTQVAA
jgi:hypothetical protein